MVGIVVVAGVALGRGRGDEATPPSDPPGSTDAVATSITPIATVETSAPIVKTQLTRTLSKGVAGEDVAAVQQRLTDLGFRPGPVDGYYGDETRRAVWAYEKLVLGAPSDAPSGTITPEVWAAMQDPIAIRPRRTATTPNHTEIYLPEQVIAVFHDGRAVFVSHMSSGDNQEWCEEVTISPGEWNNPGDEPLVRGECGKSITPGGVFQFTR